ncbi:MULTISPECIES: HU family DNA-binding protein [Ruminococcus]|jgi:DNA-binding protein HU-beta|uniref:DNA-binding protein HU-beta n=1 Tax=Ruminococcus albus 8 TaxID=246199 RepID=E9S925_RUMAL|nr:MULTISPECIES: HU family DNA-binding protein [Ruminococcus]MBE6874468.1 HU family DNA-binding protein [Ruminococcus albus]EGC04216.1 DNA-binding protein HU-beta [Ruminococcus albus 8]MBO5558230.1 HU family DNA-binding protein [Ruminococcus sp.]MBQ9542123.1 HU family DNA-binding protein [Ruminococcus sp.]MBR0530853.1 HU family DNA-binding protein [Ruminococcus sp.]
MNKAELINVIAEKGGYSKKEADKALAAVLDSITDALEKGEKVTLVGFGTFEVRDRAAKVAMNPVTKAPVDVPARKVPAFKAGSALKAAVDKK